MEGGGGGAFNSMLQGYFKGTGMEREREKGEGGGTPGGHSIQRYATERDFEGGEIFILNQNNLSCNSAVRFKMEHNAEWCIFMAHKPRLQKIGKPACPLNILMVCVLINRTFE